MLVTFSTPFVKSIYFLTNNRTGGAEARFGGESYDRRDVLS
jgi:hypothetical protein